MQSLQLSAQHLAVWNTLQNLQEGERMIGRDLMAATGITSERIFFSIIEDLREAGCYIGAKKSQGTSGYYVMTSIPEVLDYYFRKKKELDGQYESNDRNTERFLKEKFGENFDFVEYIIKEELKRYDN